MGSSVSEFMERINKFGPIGPSIRNLVGKSNVAKLMKDSVNVLKNTGICGKIIDPDPKEDEKQSTKNISKNLGK